jgi:hypothetical protein
MQVLERYSRRCIICHHPERETVEEKFVHIGAFLQLRYRAIAA